MEAITRGQLEEMLARGEDFVLVDTLGEEYYRRSLLPSVINLQLEGIDRAEEVLPTKKRRASSTV